MDTPKYNFTRLLVTHFKECFRFYRDVLGFQPGYGTENDTYADFQVGVVNISLFDKAEMSTVLGTGDRPRRPASQDHFGLIFSVENVDDWARRVQGFGIPLAAEPTDHPDWGIRTVHFRDPEGNLIELNQPLAS